eukprot:CAMPEP_0184442848 /NCGR_PEP_ID=MMETSP0738-20130409/756801_1 /TAXON_ID=385413 /ORGANISM="Thalassiosira miniscula, Strain CCMP1093" /LENGTH=66 /DNA_ID=CAMNT_0026810799 /DNA_START=142 /DNA_END=343 /DNA_ORIENTATION=-
MKDKATINHHPQLRVVEVNFDLCRVFQGDGAAPFPRPILAQTVIANRQIVGLPQREMEQDVFLAMS